MDEDEFRDFLLRESLLRTNYTIPENPQTSRDRVQYLAYLGSLVCPEYRFLSPNMDWPESPEIKEFYARFPEEKKRFNMHRRWNVLQMLRLIGHVPGDTAECGVFEGASSWLILRYSPDFRGKARQHHMFDSFEGLSAPGIHDHPDHFAKGDLECAEEKVRERLTDFKERAFYYKGWIPDRFDAVKDRQFSFVHLDVDLYDPTKASFEFFYPRIANGGIIICDDYACNTCPGATEAIDSYLQDKPEKMIPFASGGGYLIKGLKIAPLAAARGAHNA